MTAREELAQLFRDCRLTSSSDETYVDASTDDVIDTLIAAGYRKRDAAVTRLIDAVTAFDAAATLAEGGGGGIVLPVQALRDALRALKDGGGE